MFQKNFLRRYAAAINAPLGISQCPGVITPPSFSSVVCGRPPHFKCFCHMPIYRCPRVQNKRADLSLPESRKYGYQNLTVDTDSISRCSSELNASVSAVPTF
jgi:hypothetical protein